jgi:hypothetical protein
MTYDVRGIWWGPGPPPSWWPWPMADPKATVDESGARTWILPDGQRIEAWPREVYVGLEGQKRICLVEENGMTHHFDLEEISEERDGS